MNNQIVVLIGDFSTAYMRLPPNLSGIRVFCYVNVSRFTLFCFTNRHIRYTDWKRVLLMIINITHIFLMENIAAFYENVYV